MGRGGWRRCYVWTKDYLTFELAAYRWIAAWNSSTRSFYAIANVLRPNGSYTTLRMNRLLVPNCITVGHRNHRTLDNRRVLRNDKGNIRCSSD
jgi:hypothetical protein